MADTVTMVDVDHLAIDKVNIRAGEWDGNQDLVNDIKQNGIINPLLVRPAGKNRYAIVAGSRRYNAAIEAGLKKVPVFIEEMDDVTAMGRSIAENAQRKDTPAWMYAIQIGRMFSQLNHHGNKADIVPIIMTKTGFSETAVYYYLDISELPSEIIELMKSPEERSEVVKELLKATSPGESGILEFQKAAKIARELGGHVTKEKMFEVAAFVIGLPREMAFALIEKVKTYPKEPLIKLQELVTAIPKGGRYSFEFSSNIIRGLDVACVKKNQDVKSVVIYYVQEGLKNDGYL